MTTCCGKDRACRFCPDCGRELIDHPAVKLLSYCQKNAKRQRTSQRFCEQRKATDAAKKWAGEAEQWEMMAKWILDALNEEQKRMEP